MWKLRIEDDQSNRTVVNLVRPSYTIGRAEENSVRLTERNVSRRHATLTRNGDNWLLTDLDSYTGSYVNTQRIKGAVEVSHDTKIRIGDYDVLLYDDALMLDEEVVSREAMTLPAPQPDAPAGAEHDRLVVVEGQNRGEEYPLGDRRVLLGRGEECDIALNDTSVSRVHADIERDDSGRYRIGDQHSSNGVRVNGMEVQSTTLYSGDIVELGDVHLQFVPRGQVFTLSDHPRARHSGFWSNLSRTQRWASAAIGAGAMITLVAWVTAESQPPRVVGGQANPATRALSEAQHQFASGDIQGAHASLQRIGPQSNLRASASFRQIEDAWAHHQMQLAAKEQDLDARRQLLDAVAKAESVAAEYRRQAVNRLEELSARSVAPVDLPEAMVEEVDDATADAGTATGTVTEIIEPAPRPKAPKKPKTIRRPAPPSVRPAPTPVPLAEVNTSPPVVAPVEPPHPTVTTTVDTPTVSSVASP